MVFGLGAPWTTTTTGSASKLNLMTVPFGPGADLAALDKTLHKLVVCTVDGGGLLKDHVYCANAAATGWVDITVTSNHTHSGTADGGSILDILAGNPLFADTGALFMHNIDKAKWVETVVSPGTTANDTDGTTGELSLKLSTGTTSGGAGTLAMKGLKLDFSKRSSFQFKARLNIASALALHSGVNADDVTAVDSNTAKYDAEVCTVTNNNWNIRTASGSNKTASDTGIAISTNRIAIRLEHHPELGTPEVDAYIDANTVFQKTGNVPVTGTTAVANLMKHSLKNSSASDRNYYVYANRLRYYISDNWV
jgi:hypothetical protein